MTGWRLHGAWAWIAAGLAVFAASDALYVYTNAVGTTATGGSSTRLADRGAHDRAGRMAPRGAGHGPVEPAGARSPSRSGSARCAWRCSSTTTSPASTCSSLALATTALVAVLVRLAITFGQNVRMLQASRREALTDGLTGLRNRRALMTDLERILASTDREPVVFGDLRPRRLQAVQRRVRPPCRRRAPRPPRRGAGARPRRPGPGLPARRRRVLHHRVGSRRRRRRHRRRRRRALTERGEAFAVGCSFGSRASARRGRTAPPRRCGSPTSGCTSTSRAAVHRR